ncbi:MAG: hypothetical protein R3C14_13410 [Caldilineaceae bacterium]
MNAIHRSAQKQSVRLVVGQNLRQNLLLLGLMVMLLAGCSRMSDVRLPAASDPANGAAPAVDNNAPLPGTEEFGLSRQGLVEAVEKGEALIAECMKEAGFEYIPVDYNTFRRGMTSDKSAPGLGENQYAAQYGFGIATLYTGLPPQLSEPSLTPAAVGLGEQNIRIFRNLSSADQVAYNRTLFGEHTNATFAVGLETEDFSRTGGCTRSAIAQIFTQEQLNTSYLNPKDALIAADPRMQAALQKFAQCLHDGGFAYNSEREIEPDLRRRVDEITKGQPLEALAADARATLTALQEEERALAVSTLSCEEQYLDRVESQIERELYSGYQG